MTYWYVGNCTSSTYEDIQALRESARPVTWATFRKHIPTARRFFTRAGAFYDDTTNKQIEDSGFIGFYKGVHRGRPAYFAAWSGYEWIWEGA